jgi:hypothetical protein
LNSYSPGEGDCEPVIGHCSGNAAASAPGLRPCPPHLPHDRGSPHPPRLHRDRGPAPAGHLGMGEAANKAQGLRRSCPRRCDDPKEKAGDVRPFSPRPLDWGPKQLSPLYEPGPVGHAQSPRDGAAAARCPRRRRRRGLRGARARASYLSMYTDIHIYIYI